MSVLIVTSVGDVVVDLHTDRCPLTAKNFLKLCKMKYYNGCLFYKVEKDFIAQTGDPTGLGTGGDSVYKSLYGDQARFFADEIHPDLKHTKTGTVAMASAGENLNASQFYFTLRDELDYLDGKHTVFGIVEEQEGLDTLTKINESFVDDNGRPLKDIRIKHTYVLDDPFDDPPQLADLIPERSPEGKPSDERAEERLEDNWVPLDEKLGPVELQEVIRTKEAHTNAAILESIGDIPDADIKPPENVLFVCKLNPVTQDEDLFTIFSRFGTVISADIIRDYKTGDSLCYAFIEFETNEACERAYFKMDNALIDDRRIHVDFSQSVAKLWGRYRHGKRTNTDRGGCFKCGSTDHIAKDCDPGKHDKPSALKYVLKDDNRQRGGNYSQRYDMLFDEGAPEDSEEQERSKKVKVGSQRSERSRGDSNGGDIHRDRGYKKRHDDHRERTSGEYRSSDGDRHRRNEGDHRRKQADRDYNKSDRFSEKNGGDNDYHKERRHSRHGYDERRGRDHGYDERRGRDREDDREKRRKIN